MFFGGETKTTFFSPWKNIFVLIKVKRFSLENFFFLLYETNWINIFFRRIFLFFVFKSEQKKSLGQKKGKSCDIFFQDFLMFKTKFFSSALHFTHRNKILLKKIFNLRTYTFFLCEEQSKMFYFLFYKTNGIIFFPGEFFVWIKSSWKKIFHFVSQKNKQTKGVWKDPQKFWSHKHRRK